MTDLDTDSAALLERIARIGTRPRRLRLGGLTVLALAVTALGLGASASGSPNSVCAREFVLLDANDQPRAILGFREDRAPWLNLLHRNGQRGAATLAFRNEREKCRVGLSITEGGTTGLLVSDEEGRNRLAADVAADGAPSLRLIGKDGSTRWEEP